MNEYMKILGRHVRDRVTDFEGVVTSVGFDLYGCVQCVVTPPVKDGKVGDAGWFDYKRLIVKGTIPVMEVPAFELSGVEPGPEGKPAVRQIPLPR